ncbi:unnamed protein product [Dibothriocephalus latus]|uniref:Uncharacterized protein n=1 Tax=Dibothriocephalus latus TaxID=60516 RepID=A0A3P7N3N8_DIBLA|nr:unnamed protein product [Dibothriocephalus latus]
MTFTIGLGLLALLSLLPFLLSTEIEALYKRLLLIACVFCSLFFNLGIPWLFYRLQSAKYHPNIKPNGLIDHVCVNVK